MHLLLGVEGEEAEAVEGVGALTMAEAMAKEVRHNLATKVSLHFVERKSRCGETANTMHVIFPGGFGTYGYGNSANAGYSKYSFYQL